MRQISQAGDPPEFPYMRGFHHLDAARGALDDHAQIAGPTLRRSGGTSRHEKQDNE